MNLHTHMNINIYIHIYKSMFAHRTHDDESPIIPDTCLIQHVYARACACMFTLSTASTDAPSSTSTRTVSACPPSLANSNAVAPSLCEHSEVITV